MQTGYPWKGATTITLQPSKKKAFDLHIRIPGWLTEPVPGDLYSYKESGKGKTGIKVNGKAATYSLENGYAVIKRVWNKGDRVEVLFPMEVQTVISRQEVKENNNRVALQYGPLVYCIEGVDNGNNAWNIVMPENPNFETSFRPELLGGIITLQFVANVNESSLDGKSIQTVQKKITSIPYFAWNNRGATSMQVWLPTRVQNVKVNY